MKYLIPIIYLLSLQSVVSDEALQATNSFPWRLQSKKAEVVALEATNNLLEARYMALYALMSSDCVTGLKTAIIEGRTEILGVDVDVFSLMMSDFGRRYGALALFDQIIATLRKTTLESLDDIRGKKIIMKVINKNGSEANVKFTFQGKDDTLHMFLVNEKNNWRVSYFIFNKFQFPPQNDINKADLK